MANRCNQYYVDLSRCLVHASVSVLDVVMYCPSLPLKRGVKLYFVMV